MPQTGAPFVVQPRLTGLAIAYRNPELFAEDIAPRAQVPTRDFAYTVFDKGNSLSVPETLVARTGRVNQISWTGTQLSATVDDHGLEQVIPTRDVEMAVGQPIDPASIATTQTTDQLALRRELRVSNLYATPGNYAATTTVSGNDVWTNSNSDPIAQLADAKDNMLFFNPNTLVLSQRGSTVLRRNPSVISAYNKNLGTKGMVPLDFIKELLEIPNIIVCKTVINTATKGQAVTVSRLFGNTASLVYLDPNFSFDSPTPTFAATAQFKTRVAKTRWDDNIGLDGSEIVRVGEKIKELPICADAGTLIQGIY